MAQATSNNLPKLNTRWRSNACPSQKCVVTFSSPLRIKAHWIERPDEPFKTSTGNFLHSFSPEDQICTLKVAAIAQSQAVTSAQKKLANECIQYVEARLGALPALMETDHDKRIASNLLGLCRAELEERFSRLNTLASRIEQLPDHTSEGD
jgi:hypothetical protein